MLALLLSSCLPLPPFPTDEDPYPGDSGGCGDAPWVSAQEDLSGPCSEVAALAFVSPDYGWAVCGDGSVRRTWDGGASWNPAWLPIQVTAMAFDRLHGVAAGQGEILLTTNGGTSWSRLPSSAGSSRAVAVSGDDYWLAGDEGLLWGSF